MALNQDFTIFKGDLIDIEFEVENLPSPTTGAPYTLTYNLKNSDQAAFIVALTNTGGQLVLKSTTSWNRGLYTGNYNSFANSTAFSNGLPQGSSLLGNYQFVVPTTGESSTTSTDGQGAIVNITINYLNNTNVMSSFSPSVVGGGHGYVSGDTLTINKENFTDTGGTDATTDLVITLDSTTQPLPNAHPDNVGGVEIAGLDSHNGPQKIKVSITGSDYATLGTNVDNTPKQYYYELVAGVLKDYSLPVVQPEFETQVVAQGTITVNPSLFTENEFRGPY